ncbi:hypothetical protein PtrCC142_011816, partial [Pyrenophora tritici-repentis]
MPSILVKRKPEAAEEADTPFKRAQRTRKPTLKAPLGDGSQPTQPIELPESTPDPPTEPPTQVIEPPTRAIEPPSILQPLKFATDRLQGRGKCGRFGALYEVIPVFESVITELDARLRPYES